MFNKNSNFPSSLIIILLAIMYLATGISKLIGANTQVQNFEDWGFSTGFMMAVGVIEILGAIALLLPKTRFVALLGLATLMVGAVGTHLINGEYINLLLPLVLLALILYEIYKHKTNITDANLTEGDQVKY